MTTTFAPEPKTTTPTSSPLPARIADREPAARIPAARGEGGMDLPIPERAGVLRWFVWADGELRWGDTPEAAVAGTGLDAASACSLTFIPAAFEDNPYLHSEGCR